MSTTGLWRARRMALVVGALATIGCSVGNGEGYVVGTITDALCELDDAVVDLQPNFFVADDHLRGVTIRAQYGGTFELYSDGVSINVREAELEAMRLGMPVPVSNAPDSNVRMTFYYNRTCGHNKRDLEGPATVFVAEQGTILFQQLWAPALEATSGLEIALRFQGVRFVDPTRPDDRFAVLDGEVRFIVNRGRPAQRFP